ncbi:MAG: lysozyme [Xenococcaceae cyanobacterium MO_188.B32]|nr:lysozyme [Xenococcaceae cyanobacterium MO_188.B32]
MSFKSTIFNKYFSSKVILAIVLIAPTVFSANAMAASQAQGDKMLIKESQSKTINLQKAIAHHTPSVRKSTINLIKHYEGFHSTAYIDTHGLPVIGYGQSKINGKRVKMGQYISRSKADAELAKELYRIQRLVLSKVKVKLTPNQLGALTSITYNVGPGILTRSTLVRKLNAGDYAGAAREFPRWNKAHQGGRLVPFPGLTRRRLAEQKLFLTP